MSTSNKPVARKQHPAECQYYSILTREFLEKKKKIKLFTNHGPSIGSYHEALFKTFLKMHLPKSLSIATGFITNGQKSSRQCDILIYNSAQFSPLFQEGEFVVLGSEAAIAAIEIKANIGSVKTIHEAFDNLVSIRSVAPLARTFLLGFDASGMTALSFELAMRNYKALSVEQQIRAILILEKEWLWNCLDINMGHKKFVPTHERDVPLNYFMAVIKSLCDVHLKQKADINRYFDMDTFARTESKRVIQFGQPLVAGEKEYLEGVNFSDVKKHQRAIDSFLKAKILGYEDDGMDTTLACSYANLGNMSSAIATLENMGDRLQSKEDMNLYGRMLLSSDCSNLINLRKGVDILEKSLTGFSHDFEKLVLIAYNLVRLGEYRRSIEFSKKAIGYHPNDLMCDINIGLAYKKMGASADFDSLNLKDKIKQADVWEASLIFALIGERDNCFKSLKRAVKLHPTIKKELLHTVEFEELYSDSVFLEISI